MTNQAIGKAALSGKYAAYPEYKDSGVEWLGDIPLSWSLTRHKYIASFQKGKNPELLLDDVEDGAIRYLSMDYLRGNSVSLYALPEKNSYIAKKDQVLIIWDGSNAGEFVKGQDGIVSSTMAASEYLSDINHKFYWYLCLCIEPEMRKHSNGMGIPHVNGNELKNSMIVLPSDCEQQKIANFLDHETAKIDTLIEKQQQLIKLLKEKRQAVISHAVTKGLNPNAPMRDSGVEWLGEVPEHWVKKIKLSAMSESNRGSFVNGPFGSDLLANELRDEGVPVVYIRDIKRTGYKRKSTVCVTPKKAEQLEVCKVVFGDVIISKVGDPPGDACIYPEGEPDAIITQDVIRIRVDRFIANPEYLVMLLNSDFGQMVMNDISVEGTRKRVSLGDFKATKFVMPSLDEQDRIVAYVHEQCLKMDTLIGKSEDVVVLIRERRTTLISAAVTGKIDVREWTPA